MPISRDALFQKKPDFEERILQLLRDHHDEAYSAIEICVLLEGARDMAEGKFWLLLMDMAQRHKVLQPYTDELTRLANQGKVVHDVVAGEDYFTIADKK